MDKSGVFNTDKSLQQYADEKERKLQEFNYDTTYCEKPLLPCV